MSSSIARFLRRNTGNSSTTQEDNSSGTSTSYPGESSTSSQEQKQTEDGHEGQGRMPTAGTQNAQGDLFGSDYARSFRELLSLARKLSDLGADKLLDVPKIAVIGNQSAGKSSLVEAVTGISVPRDAGMCTRCPMECTIKSSGVSRWSCTVSTREENGATTPFSPVLINKADVELWIRRAQAAMLCPNLPSVTFERKDRDEIKEITDTKKHPEVHTVTGNKVVIDIDDPDGANLAFVDLPGLVQNEQPHVIKLIRDLVEESISSPSTIILVTIPASDDMENQQAIMLAKGADPAGQRTIGVVTKPDMLAAGSSGLRQTWKEIIEGVHEKHQLRLGCYCVRLPNDDERKRGLSRQQQREISDRFFSTTSPWKDLQVSGRTGIDNLVRDLSTLLMRVLREALPQLREKANELLKQCLLAISKHPKPVNAIAEVMQRVSRFCHEMQNVVNGRCEDRSFVHDSREAYRLLRIDIRRTAPDFRPFEDPESHIRPPEPQFQKDEDIEAVRLESLYAKSTRPWIQTVEVEYEEHILGLVFVRDTIADCMGWEIHPHIPYEAKVRLIKRSCDRWLAPSRTCFDRIELILQEVVARYVSTHFRGFPALEGYIESLLRTKQEEHVVNALVALNAVIERESTPYWTKDDYDIATKMKEWLHHYNYVRINHHLYDELPQSAPGSPSSVYAYGDAQYDNTMSYPEMQVMAFVRSFFGVVHKRVVDGVTSAIRQHFVHDFADGLHGYLLEKLDVSDPASLDRLQAFVVEDPMVARNRVWLQDRRRKLEEIKTLLDNYRV